MRVVAPVAVAVALALGAPAARAEDLPPGRLSLVLAMRHGTGQVADDIGIGELIGFEAAWQPMAVGQRLGWGVSWSLLLDCPFAFCHRWGWFGDGGAARITGSLDLIQLDLAVRMRFAPTPTPGRCLTLGVGGMLLRSHERLAPDDRRDYFGPFAELGYEHLAWGSLSATFHLRLGPIGGPTILFGLLGIGVAL